VTNCLYGIELGSKKIEIEKKCKRMGPTALAEFKTFQTENFNDFHVHLHQHQHQHLIAVSVPSPSPFKSLFLLLSNQTKWKTNFTTTNSSSLSTGTTRCYSGWLPIFNSLRIEFFFRLILYLSFSRNISFKTSFLLFSFFFLELSNTLQGL